MRTTVGALAIALVLAGCGGPPGGDTGAAPATRYPVEIASVVSEAPQRSLSAPAALEAIETVRIAARVSGVVDRVLVREGDAVQPGQAVAEIDAERYRLAVDAARADLARAQAVRDDAAAGLARRERGAREQPGLVSDEELAQAKARSMQADADVAGATARLARAELDLRDAQVRSPVAGVVQSRQAATGDPLQPGSPIATVIDRSEVRLRFAVPAADAAEVRPGLAVAFRVAGEAAERAASVVLVGEAADARTRLVEVVARVVRPGEVRPGTFAEAHIDLPPGLPRLLVPDLAVRPSEKGCLVWVVDGGGDTATVRERTIAMGARTRDGRIEVLSGLAAGDRVVVRGGEALHAGAPLAIAGNKAGK